MSSTRYPDQTTFGFRVGVTCMTSAGGVLLVDPPHREEFADFTSGQLRAVHRLKERAATVEELCSSQENDDIPALLDSLAAGGWLTTTVRDNDKDCYSIIPFARPGPPPPSQRLGRAQLSKFAVLHRDRDGLVLEHPLGWCDLRIHDCDLLAVLGGSAPSGSPSTVASHLLEDLHRCGFVVLGRRGGRPIRNRELERTRPLVPPVGSGRKVSR